MIIGARDRIEIVCQAGRKANQQTDVAGRMVTGLYQLLSALGLYLRHQATYSSRHQPARHGCRSVCAAALLLNVQHACGNKTDPALVIHHVCTCMVRMKRGRGRRERGNPRGRRNRVPRMRSCGDTRVRTRRRKQRASSRAAAAACSMRTARVQAGKQKQRQHACGGERAPPPRAILGTREQAGDGDARCDRRQAERRSDRWAIAATSRQARRRGGRAGGCGQRARG
jgi:hypothetical protein